jgi:hypothetical protein
MHRHHRCLKRQYALEWHTGRSATHKEDVAAQELAKRVDALIKQQKDRVA